MYEKQIKAYELLKEFISIANKHSLKYMIMYGTLLGAKRHSGFIPWDDDIDLVVPKETLDFLIKNYPSKIYTPENGNSPLLIPKFTNDKPENEDAVFLDLFLTIPTSKERIKKFLSFKNKIRYLHTFSRRKTFKCQWGLRIVRFFSLLTWITKKYKITDAYEDLYEKDSNLVCVLNFPINKLTYKNTYSNLNYETSIEDKFVDLTVKIPNNWEEILIQTYGNDWETPIKFKNCEHLGLYDMKKFIYKKKDKK
ncbi:diacylglycerol cholinephosphotransferase Mf1 [Mycoplasma tauri]|uniref:diacylglycerol cholinephosphotransferase Mf1 n=1 Tax=Mycoplasma tauri TaxID=547987 RepID=UPI001967F488|nr:LicD family protein [Mycoplasma tauri]MBZ4203615.1 LicD family protein [Mycoplasma tauri]MBZ4204508.1 LicD family protein [Mycoplasma tauri]MBZ4218147.1 LicD family protein [Mycoplasma tauri]MBZ4226857.1 LicD family protein [Mycoplasma tauri]QSB07765.1 LicD family protein [Mycoplasma tauri]